MHILLKSILVLLCMSLVSSQVDNESTTPLFIGVSEINLNSSNETTTTSTETTPTTEASIPNVTGAKAFLGMSEQPVDTITQTLGRELVKPLKAVAKSANRIATSVVNFLSFIPGVRFLADPIIATGRGANRLANSIDELIATHGPKVDSVSRSTRRIGRMMRSVRQVLESPNSVVNNFNPQATLKSLVRSFAASAFGRSVINLGFTVRHFGKALIEIGSGISAVGSDIFAYSTGQKKFPEIRNFDDFFAAFNFSRILPPAASAHFNEFVTPMAGFSLPELKTF